MMQDPKLAARHFDDSAQRVVRHIAERASDRGMHAGELTGSTAGMLAILSMLRWERKVGRAALEHVIADCDAFARELDNVIEEEGRKTRWPTGPRLMTLPSGETGIIVDRRLPLEKLLEQAEHEALGMSHNWVGTEHLLLAAIKCACPTLNKLMERFGITYENARQAVLELLRP